MSISAIPAPGPTYSEFNALNNHVSMFLDMGTEYNDPDFDTKTTPGRYYGAGTWTNGPSGIDSGQYVLYVTYRDSTARCCQFLIKYHRDDPTIYFRLMNGPDTFTNWKCISFE